MTNPRPKSLRHFAKENRIVIDALCDIMQEHSVPPKRGEQILLYLAGLSKGARVETATTDIDYLAYGWQVGVKYSE
jgi:hypothetical protein